MGSLPPPHPKPVQVSLTELQSGSIPFATLLEAFGPSSLGILLVSDLPTSFSTLRTKVLTNASRLASLPPSTLDRLTNPAAKYLVGWSHGKETLRPGITDTLKGSYYINCAFYVDPELQGGDASKFPGFEEYTAPNVWVDDAEIADFQHDAQALITLIIDVAVLVARACDVYAAKEIEGYPAGYLERMVRESTTTKARLLHYFPNTNSSASAEVLDSWCATHLDHGCLTGLTSAQFLDEDSDQPLSEIVSPSASAGLYIQSRTGETHKVGIPRDCLAFQTGEALELITQGKFKAVPHFVRGVEAGSGRVARNTLAVFTQPNLDEIVDGRTGLTFGEFARGVVKKNTAQ